MAVSKKREFFSLANSGFLKTTKTTIRKNIIPPIQNMAEKMCSIRKKI